MVLLAVTMTSSPCSACCILAWPSSGSMPGVLFVLFPPTVQVLGLLPSQPPFPCCKPGKGGTYLGPPYLGLLSTNVFNTARLLPLNPRAHSTENCRFCWGTVVGVAWRGVARLGMAWHGVV